MCVCVCVCVCVCEREREKGRQTWTEVIVKVMLEDDRCRRKEAM